MGYPKHHVARVVVFLVAQCLVGLIQGGPRGDGGECRLAVGGEGYVFHDVELALREGGRGSFGQDGKPNKRGRLLEAMAADPETALRVFRFLNECPAVAAGTGWDGSGYRSLYERDRIGIGGAFTGLLSNDALVGFAGAINGFAREAKERGYPFRNGLLSNEWRRKTCAGLVGFLDADGFIASGEQGGRWEMGFQFHLMRKRIHWLDYVSAEGRKVNALSRIWPGGKDGAGSRLVLFLLTDEYHFVTPAHPGQRTRILPVNRMWAERQRRKGRSANAVRIGDGMESAEFEVGLFTAWRTAQPSYHGTWDGLVIMNKLYAANGASVFCLLESEKRPLIRSALRNLLRKLGADPASSAGRDYSGYPPKEMRHWRSLCMEEIEKPGVQYLLEARDGQSPVEN